MIKSYKIRIYPTKKQEEMIYMHINSCRYIWNYMLALQEERYKNGEKHLSHYDMNKTITVLKSDGEHKWLKQVATTSLRIICNDLDLAYKTFFNNTRQHPKFKSRKKSKPMYPVRSERFYFKDDKTLNIEKVGKVKYKTDFTLPIGTGHKFSNVRVSNELGKWMVSFGIECENQAQDLNDFNVGIDLGIKELAVVAYDDKNIVFHNINKSKKVKALQKRLKHEQKSVSRKYEQNKQGNKYIKTKNIEKQEQTIRKLYKKISDIRNNYIHQVTHQIISLLPQRVVMEDLNVSGMMKNRHLSKAIAEQEFYKFISYMKYKCEWNGIEFTQVDRFYPSSKTCSCCGCVKSNLKLKDRIFVCDDCGLIIDRDLNAAINLMNYVA